MNKKRPHLDYARTHRQLDDNFATVPEMTIISMLPAKIFDKGPSLAVALGLCVGLSFGVGILSGWYSYRTTDAHAQALWSQDHLQKIASATEAHRVRMAPSALTFFDELRQPSQKEQMQLEKQAPPKHLVAALDPAVPVNQGKADAPKAVEKAPKVPVAVASEPVQKPSKAALPAVVSKAALKEDRGDQMASALARLLGEPQAAVAHKPRSMARVIPSIPKPQKDGPWRIQTSMFSDSYKAKALVDHLQSKGYNVALKPKADGFYVVHISGFNDEDAALTAQENLSREEGLSTSLIRP